jgi:hypothetical protein
MPFLYKAVFNIRIIYGKILCPGGRRASEEKYGPVNRVCQGAAKDEFPPCYIFFCIFKMG